MILRTLLLASLSLATVAAAQEAPAPAPAPAPAAPPRAGTIVQRLEALEATVATLLAAAEENSALRRRVEGLEALVGA